MLLMGFVTFDEVGPSLLPSAIYLALHTLEGWANYGKWVWPESALEQAKRNTTESITTANLSFASTQKGAQC